MFQFILWYLTISLLGLLSFPLAHRLFPALADRGYSLSRALGLLLWGFVFWLSVSVGLARNEMGGLLFALAVIAVLSAWSLWQAQTEDEPAAFNLPTIIDWLKANLRLVLSIELLFLVAFAAWAFVRANNPDTVGTEKPMEIAFINAVLRSPSFPPHDPWLSGYAISYYYFGYVLASMLAMITATNGGMTFNLMLSLVFAMSVIGSYGLLYNLLSAYSRRVSGPSSSTGIIRDLPPTTVYRLPSTVLSLFAPVFLVLMGNVEGFLELLRAYGVGWANPTSNFWLWLNIKELSDAPVAPFVWQPRFWFWWRASRVLQDFDLRGNFVEIIDEFPFFSYLLGDLHPHVLAMPFGLLAAALALNLYLGGWKGITNIFGFKLPLRKEGLALTAVVLGGLAFLNTWDFPVYLALVSGAFLLALVHDQGWNWGLLEDFFKFLILMALASILLYLPFYVGFSSQAGGILPNIIFPTRGAYLWIMFGTLLVPLFLFLFSLFGKRPANWKTGFLLTLGGALLLWIFSVVLGIAAAQTDAGRLFVTDQGLTSTQDVLLAATQLRLKYGAGLLTLLVLIGIALSYLLGNRNETRDIDEQNIYPDSVSDDAAALSLLPISSQISDGTPVSPLPSPDLDLPLLSSTVSRLPIPTTDAQLPPVEADVLPLLPSTVYRLPSISPIPFILMLILFGGLLVLAPEFVYLRDQFSSRMNTVFKFYYQAWALWSLAAAFGVVVLIHEMNKIKLALFSVMIMIVFGVGLTYPLLSLPNKTDDFNAADIGRRTFDGAAYLAYNSPDDYSAILWLTQAPLGNVVEAVGGSYSEFARISTYSGQPSVLGWAMHESQWRGGYTEVGSRSDEIARLYTTADWNEAQSIIQHYNVRYIYIGQLERATYPVNEFKFSSNLSEAYRQGTVVIYQVP